MRVKIGDEWFDCKPGRPILVELSPQDKANIAGMPHELTQYAAFADDDPDFATEDARRTWMNAGRRAP